MSLERLAEVMKHKAGKLEVVEKFWGGFYCRYTEEHPFVNWMGEGRTPDEAAKALLKIIDARKINIDSQQQVA